MGRGRKTPGCGRKAPVRQNNKKKRKYATQTEAMSQGAALCPSYIDPELLDEPNEAISERTSIPVEVIELNNYLFSLLVDSGIRGACLSSSILAVEALSAAGYDSVVVEGFQEFSGLVLWHCWVEVMGKPIDIGGAVTKAVIRRHKGIILPSTSLITELPNDCVRTDMGTREEVANLEENIRLLRLYQEKGASEFWGTTVKSPEKTKMLEIRSRVLNFIKMNK